MTWGLAASLRLRSLSLAVARVRATAVRRERDDGADPIALRQAKKAAAAQDASAARHTFKSVADLMAVLQPIWHVKGKTARRTAHRIEEVMKWAVSTDAPVRIRSRLCWIC